MSITYKKTCSNVAAFEQEQSAGHVCGQGQISMYYDTITATQGQNIFIMTKALKGGIYH